MPNREAIPVARPRLPTADAILPYLRELDEARRYANHGALTRRLEGRLRLRSPLFFKAAVGAIRGKASARRQLGDLKFLLSY